MGTFVSLWETHNSAVGVHVLWVPVTTLCVTLDNKKNLSINIYTYSICIHTTWAKISCFPIFKQTELFSIFGQDFLVKKMLSIIKNSLNLMFIQSASQWNTTKKRSGTVYCTIKHLTLYCIVNSILLQQFISLLLIRFVY